jgi:1,2-diacylglycerol 3-alpha-glucosyltransferase
MNIGIFTDCYLPTKNGVSTSIVHLKEGLAQRGHQVRLFTVQYPHYDERDPTTYRFPSLSFNSTLELRAGLVSQRTMNRIVQAQQLDILHTHTEFSLGWAGRRAARRFNIPLAHTAHTMYQDYRHYLWGGQHLPPKLIQWMLKCFLSSHAAVICPSQKMQAYLSAFVPASKTVVLGNGVSRARFSPQRLTPAERAKLRHTLGLEASDKLMLCVGRLAQEKRVLELLEALAPLLRQHLEYKIIFVGGGPLDGQMRALAHSRNVAQQIILTGYIPWEKMRNIYALADLFVTASLSEVHPMTLIEATMCGLPIVARRDASYADLVQEGYNGHLAATDLQLTELVAGLFQDDAKRYAFSHHALIRAEEFTSDKHVERCEALYQEVLQKKFFTTEGHR